MTARIRLLVALPMLFVVSVTLAGAADPPPTTTLTVPDLDCPSCAKRLATKLLLLPGAEKVETNVDAKTVKVTHKAGEALSPKALWEASAKAGFDPSKLVGPDGTFTTKPTK